MNIAKKILVVGSIVAIFAISTEVLVRFRMNLVRVLVVKETLPQRHLITKDDITSLKTSRHLIPDDAILKEEDIVGSYVKMSHTLLKNQIIRADNIESLSEAIDAPHLLLNKDERVYALKKDVVGSAGATLQVGSYVDIGVQNKKDEDYGIMMENIRVVGIKDRNGVSVNEGGVPHVVLLAIENDDIKALLKYEEEGKIVLLPRDYHNAS